jgi:alpha-ribazole phosphatase
MDSEQRNNGKRLVFLLRHGDSRRDYLKRYVGQVDIPLNEKGRAQAEKLRRQVAEIPFSAFYCSDLCRSLETARLIAGPRADEVKPLSGLREIFMGQWDGQPMDEVKKSFPREYRCRGEDIARHAAPGGESFADVRKRILPVFDAIAEASEGPVLIVGHAGINRVILTHLLGMPLENLFRIGQDYGCINIIVSERGSFSVRSMNLESFADAGAFVPAEFPFPR